ARMSLAISHLSLHTETTSTELYTLSLHDALPIYQMREQAAEIAKKLTPSKIDEILNAAPFADEEMRERVKDALKALHKNHYALEDRKSTRLNSSHLVISYAVFCLKKKNAA